MPLLVCLLALVVTLVLVAKIGWIGLILLVVALRMAGAVLRLLFGR